MCSENMEINQKKDFKFNKFILFRRLKNDKIIKKIEKILQNFEKKTKNKIDLEKNYSKILNYIIELAEKKGFQGELIKKYIFYKFITDENIFTIKCDKYSGDIGSSLYDAAVLDIKKLKKIIKLFSYNYFLENKYSKYSFFYNYQPKKVDKFDEVLSKFINQIELDIDNEKEIVDNLIKYYIENGYGEYSLGTAFRWSQGKKRFYKIDKYDNIRFENIIGYDYQKNIIIENTRQFIKGKRASNILLMGARGTGKSSCVKASVNMFKENGLKIIEINKKQLLDLPIIMKKISNSSRRFIVFIDDLSFEENDYEYKEIKSVIEGGLQTLMENVVIYATSNRRHIMKEVWKDRDELDEEIHLNDTINEKLSLSDRFGIKIIFLSPTEEEYLNIVDGLANIHNIQINEKLHREALQWELSQNKKSGRTAKQFIDFVLRG
ncbi:MAG: ATP-binding protein [Fusobacteria bacterium]|nr:ATP-binding protein [Fusobacteriota bacterium]